jgi:AcrR family transcriptional regulator
MDRRRQILEAARKVAAREGFHGATIQKIAAEAGLKSPSHVYWYFKNKKALFQTMMEELSPVLRQLPNMWARIDEPPEELLYFIGRNFLQTFENPEARQLFRIFFMELGRSQDTANNFAEKALLLLTFLVAYLDHHIETGRLRHHDTQSSARSFIGSFVIYMLGSELFIPLRAGLPAKEDYAREVVSIFLKGLSPDGQQQ